MRAAAISVNALVRVGAFVVGLVAPDVIDAERGAVGAGGDLFDHLAAAARRPCRQTVEAIEPLPSPDNADGWALEQVTTGRAAEFDQNVGGWWLSNRVPASAR